MQVCFYLILLFSIAKQIFLCYTLYIHYIKRTFTDKKVIHSTLKGCDLFQPNEEIYIHKSTSLPEYVGKLHSHDFVEITYVVSGECEHIENGEVYHAKKGDLFIINYGVPHANRLIPNSKEPFIAYDCAFRPDFIDISLSGRMKFIDIASSFLFNSLFDKNVPDLSHLTLKNNSFFEMEGIFQLLLSEYTEKKVGYYDLIRAYLIELIVKIFRKLQAHNVNELSKETKQDGYIKLAIQYVETHYSEKIELKDIAYRSFFSVSHFSRLFKSTTGMCFSEYIQKTRVKHACEMLNDSKLSISEIADRTGFTDIKFFYTIFKKIIGKTPGEYRLK